MKLCVFYRHAVLHYMHHDTTRILPEHIYYFKLHNKLRINELLFSSACLTLPLLMAKQ